MADPLELIGRLLKDSLSVMVVDDDDQVLETVCGYIELCPLFRVEPVHDVSKARALAQARPWHCWLVDLYVPDIADGMGLMEEFSATVPTIAMSGLSTGGEGYRCSQLSVVGFIDKSELNAPALVDRVFRLALTKLLCCRYPSLPNSKVAESAMEALFKNAPESVGEWSRQLQVTARTLEQWTRECGSYKPNTILSLFHVYRVAYEYTMSAEGHPRFSPGQMAVVQRFAERPSRLRELLSKTVQNSAATPA
jgi:CheY-like chemotaxis protein